MTRASSMPKPKFKSKRRNGGPRDGDRGAMLNRDELDNEKFRAYYTAQNILPEDEWPVFLATLRSPLPTTFRISSSALSLNRIIEQTDIDPKPTKLPWFPPEQTVWQFDIARKQIKKTDGYKAFHNFLIYETDSGNISRQEAVSMLPPLFLDLRQGLRVMDMCAAPGSKTAQIIEALAGDGVCIANDSDFKRCGLLIHQSARLPSPALLVTNLDASNYPGVKLINDGTLRFDRILCDVPCSGDGTLRKNIAIWKKWNIADANGLHILQSNILRRAMNMLNPSSPDARIVYSTCSFNPVENEAVIAAALHTHPHFQLVDSSEVFPLLQRRPGLTTWTPQGRGGTVYPTYASCLEAGKDTKMVESMWPPSNQEGLHLERCMRFYPHQQDTGGFFVAVLQRRPKDAIVVSPPAPVQPATSSSAQKRPAEESEAPDTHENKKPKLSSSSSSSSTPPDAPIAPFSENPYTLLPPTHPLITTLTQSLNLLPTFPFSNLLTRNPSGESIRTVYLVNDIVKKILEGNDYKKLRIHSAGVKVFTRHQSASSTAGGGEWVFRVSYEGLDHLIPHIPPSKITLITKNDLRLLCEEFFPLCTTFQEESFKSVVAEAPFGNLVVKFVSSGEDGEKEVMYLPCWKSHTSIGLMVDKRSKTALSLRLFGADITPSKPAAGHKKQQEEEATVVALEDIEAEAEGEGKDKDVLMESGDI